MTACYYVVSEVVFLDGSLFSHYAAGKVVFLDGNLFSYFASGGGGDS